MPVVRTTRAATASVLLIVVTVLGSATVAPGAQAAATSVETATLTWSISPYVATSMSLANGRAATAPTTINESTGIWTFHNGTGSYDPDNGAADIDFPGAMELGNTSFGNFAIRFSNLHLGITGDTGELTADVAVRRPGASTFDPTTAAVVIARFTVEPGTHSAPSISWTTTPETDDVTTDPAFTGAQQFPSELIDALPASMRGFFQQTKPEGDPQNADKLPATINWSIHTAVTSTTTTPATTIAPTTTPTTTMPATSSTPITSGTLIWGIKSSFVDYIGGAAGGSIQVIAPATPGPDGDFSFVSRVGGRYAGPDNLHALFAGSVHLTGHGGILDITIANPEVVIDGNAASLIVDATSKELTEFPPNASTPPGELITSDDLTIATLDLSGVQATASGDDVSYTNVPTSLTDDGVQVFGGLYATGEILAPVSFTVHVAGAGSDLPDATTQMIGCLDATTIAAGSVINLCADGFTPGEQVQAFIHSDPVLLGLTSADERGHVNAEFTLPLDLAAGVHHFELRGVSSGNSVRSAAITVTAVAGPTDSTAATLPATGTDAFDLAALGTIMLFAGVAVTVAARRRRSSLG